jgi:hypothetical protein
MNFLNASNESQYVLQQNSFITLIEDTINSVENIEELYQKLPHLKSTYSNGLLMKKVFDKNGKYLGKRETKEEKRVYAYHKRQRDNYTNGRVQPRKANVIKYGLQEYFG